MHLAYIRIFALVSGGGKGEGDHLVARRKKPKALHIQPLLYASGEIFLMGVLRMSEYKIREDGRR